jgi:hypothetical protein
MNIKPFKIKISQTKVDDLHERIKKTIWPAVIPGQNYGGPELASIKDLAQKGSRAEQAAALYDRNRRPNHSFHPC